ncbi:MAG TPA: queuosine precursor transporter [Opitutales bacterium]|nr:queuosine precursor transporter [Opitutales bacterium]
MIGLDPNRWIMALHSWPPACVGLLMLAVCIFSIWGFLYAFGESGLYVYTAVALIVGNIQVVKVIEVAFLPDPVAMGTVVYSSIFLSTNILSECYGPAKARRAIWLGFFAYACVTVLMLVTIGMRPLGEHYSVDEEWAWAMPTHTHLEAIFAPAPAVLIAGMFAFIISQLYDVWIYQRLRRWSKGKLLWLRNAVSYMVSALLDDVIFSILAWRVFTADPVPWDAVLYTYIFGTYVLRLIIGLFNIPIMYWVRAYMPKPYGEIFHKGLA